MDGATQIVCGRRERDEPPAVALLRVQIMPQKLNEIGVWGKDTGVLVPKVAAALSWRAK